MLVMLLAGPTALRAAEPSAPITAFGDELDPDSDCDVTEEGGVATISLPGTWHDLTHTDEYSRLNAPRLLHDVEGDFSVQVHVHDYELPQQDDSSGGRYAFRGTGILVWQDDDNFLRFERAAIPRGPFVWVERFADGASASQEIQEIGRSEAWLRATRTGGELKFERSEDGEHWTTVQVVNAELPARLKVGVHAINTTNKPFAAKLSEYQLTP
jgi:regulation of enolase protein 1 (concanavalin A-like superfamily)